MAVRMMVSADKAGRPNVETVTGYPGYSGTLYMETTYVGRVLALRERNGYDDSDFEARVWDDETESPKWIEYASTRGWTYPNGAAVDATPEVVEKARAWDEARAAEYRAFLAAEDAKLPKRGRTVKVVRGRKVPLGTVGRVFWHGPNTFRTYYRNGYNKPDPYDRVGIETASGERFFTAGSNVEVVAEEVTA